MSVRIDVAKLWSTTALEHPAADEAGITKLFATVVLNDDVEVHVAKMFATVVLESGGASVSKLFATAVVEQDGGRRVCQATIANRRF